MFGCFSRGDDARAITSRGVDNSQKDAFDHTYCHIADLGWSASKKSAGELAAPR